MGSVELNGNTYPALDGLGQCVMDCERDICCTRTRFEYPTMKAQRWREEDISDKFRSTFKCMNGHGSVYAILGCQERECELTYIGTRNKLNLYGRIEEHLVKKSDSTSSALERVKSSVWRGSGIEISYILVEPDNLRLFVEQELIEKLNPPWNKRRG